MRVLVCGGAGYIGSHMCKMLAALGHQATVFDDLSTGHASAVRWGPLVRGNLLDGDDVDRALASVRYDVVMHFSARSLVGESVQRPDLYYRNNVVGTLNLLDRMVRHGVGKLIFSSSAAVYGTPQRTPIDEQHDTRPINPYGSSKLMVERALIDYESAFGLKSVSLRYFNAAGADPGGDIGEDHEPETHLIPNVLRSIVDSRRNPLQVFGDDYPTPDGTCVRDYIHVNDLCDAHLRAIDYLNSGGNSDRFNLGNGRGFSVREVIEAARAVTGAEIPYVVVARRPGDPPVLVAASAKAERALGWTARYRELPDIIATAWNWHRRSSGEQRGAFGR